MRDAEYLVEIVAASINCGCKNCGEKSQENLGKGLKKKLLINAWFIITLILIIKDLNRLF